MAVRWRKCPQRSMSFSDRLWLSPKGSLRSSWTGPRGQLELHYWTSAKMRRQTECSGWTNLHRWTLWHWQRGSLRVWKTKNLWRKLHFLRLSTLTVRPSSISWSSKSVSTRTLQVEGAQGHIVPDQATNDGRFLGLETTSQLPDISEDRHGYGRASEKIRHLCIISRLYGRINHLLSCHQWTRDWNCSKRSLLSYRKLSHVFRICCGVQSTVAGQGCIYRAAILTITALWDGRAI